jgi:hypothetical protein
LEILNNLHQSSQGSFYKMLLSPPHRPPLPHVNPLVLFNPIGILVGVNNLVTCIMLSNDKYWLDKPIHCLTMPHTI